MSTAAAAAAPTPAVQSDEEVLSSMGLSAAMAAELLSSPDALLEKCGDMTVEQFLQQQCTRHVSALHSYCEQRVNTIQKEGEQAMELIKAEYAPQ